VVRGSIVDYNRGSIVDYNLQLKPERQVLSKLQIDRNALNS